MPSILIVGNVTKDVYLRLDNRVNHFETDQNGVKWLDLSFDNSHFNYYSRVSIYGGASISLEVLSRFGLDASISGTPATFLDGQFVAKDIHTTYRYILCQDENTSHLEPSEEVYTTWQVPTTNPDWIYLDSSAVISPKLATEILDYLKRKLGVTTLESCVDVIRAVVRDDLLGLFLGFGCFGRIGFLR